MEREKTYSINECFYSVQGEGARVGTANVFLRFAGCNLQCVDAAKLSRPMGPREVDAGFHCDTDFAKGIRMTLAEVLSLVDSTDTGRSKCVILTGGEPTLQMDILLLAGLRRAGYHVAIETNGTVFLKPALVEYINWIACSPKPNTKIALDKANEIRCVVKPGQDPDPRGIAAGNLFVSPASFAPTAENVSGWKGSAQDFDKAAMAHAVAWCLKNPKWRISIQTHKLLGVR